MSSHQLRMCVYLPISCEAMSMYFSQDAKLIGLEGCWNRVPFIETTVSPPDSEKNPRPQRIKRSLLFILLLLCYCYSCSQYTYYMYYHTPTACYMALTCCDLVTPDGDIGLGQHWLRHIAWTDAHFSLVRFYEIQLEAILQRLHKQLFSVMSFENCT